MSRCLVTGGAGFIGGHVARVLLEAGHEVAVLDDFSGGFEENVPTGCRLVRASVVDHEAVEEITRSFRPEVVFHLAAYAAEGLSHFIKRFNANNNIVGSVNVINACVNYDVQRLVFTSSAAVYGHAPGLLTEDSTPVPADSYGIAKLAVEQELAVTHEMFGLPYAVLRPHNVYGPGQNIADRYRNVVGIFMNQAMQGQPLTVFGDGSQTRQFSYIREVAEVIASAGFHPQFVNQVVNVGSDDAVTVGELTEAVSQALGVSLQVRHVAPRNELMHVSPSHEKLKRLWPEWKATPIREGIAEMARWARRVGPRDPCVFSAIEIERGLPPVWRVSRPG